MTVAFVQKSAVQLFADNASSIAPSRTGTTAGNHAVCLVACSNGTTTSPATALSAPSGWTAAENAAGPAGGNNYKPVTGIFYKENLAGGTETATVSLPAGSYAQAIISEASGVATSSSLDVHTSKTATSGTSSDTGTTGTTAVADSIVYVVLHPEDTVGSTSGLPATPTTGYTNLDNTTSNAAHIATQFAYKILSATGTQVANSGTWTTSSFFMGSIAVFKGTAAGGTSVNPGVGTVAITGYAPTIAQPQTANPGVGTVTITGYAPAVVQNSNVAPGVGSLAITGYAPSISQPQTAGPGVGALALTGYAPTISQPQTAAPGVGTVAITGYAPAVTQGANVSADVGTVAITGYAPSLAQTANQAVSAGVGTVVLTGYAPTVVQASASTSVDAGAGVLTITGYAPDVVQTGGGGRDDGKAKVRKRVNEANKRILEAEALEEAQEITQAVTKAKSAQKSAPATQGFDEDEEEALMLLL